MKSILDKSFKYVNSGQTDIAATFKRIRREQKEQAEREQAIQQEVAVKVRRMK